MRRAAAALTISLALLVGCGGDDEEATDATGATEPDEGAADTVAGSIDPIDAAGDDQCTVEVTGDKTASWTSPGGIMALNTEYWLPPDQAQSFGEGFYFIINCDGTGRGGSLSFVAGMNATAEDIPFGPKTYTLSPASNRLGGTNPDDPITVFVTLEDSETNWGVSEPGVLEITAFDENHIAGRFEFTATDLLHDLGGVPSEGTVRVTGEFSYRNPN